MIPFLLAACGERAPEAASCDESALAIGGQLRDFGGVSTFVHRPPITDACLPLMVFLHGTSGSGSFDGTTWIEPTQMQLSEAADAHRFVLAVPGVYEVAADHDWSLTEGSAREIDAVFEALAAATNPERAIVVGISKGGKMAAWYGLHHPTLAQGIGVVSGGYGFGYPSVEPDPKLPYYIAHDPADTTSPYEDVVELQADLEAHGHDAVLVEWDLGEDGHGWNPDLPGALVEHFLAE